MQKRIFIFCERPPTQSRDEGCLRTKRREEMKRIKLFADNMSTGLWDATTNQSITMPDEFPEYYHVLIEQWHDIFEFVIEQGNVSESYKQAWEHNGEKIVEMLNQYCKQQSLKYKFIYVKQ